MLSATAVGEAGDTAAADDRFAGLLARAKVNDRAAFGDLYQACVTPVYRYLHARVGETAIAEELTQDVFLAALAGLSDLRTKDESAFFGWLFQVARYKLADHLRRRYRKPASPLEEAGEVADERHLPQAEAEANEERRELRHALERLTPEQREVVLCKYVLDFDNERTARLMGKNANAINQLHHRALASLQRLLAKPGKVG